MRKTVFLMLFSTLLFIPSFAGAVDGIVPCEGTYISGSECGTCEFIALMNNTISFVIKIMLMVTFLLFAYVGFLMVTSKGNISAYNRAKGLFSNVVTGLIIMLAAWLLIDTVMKVLLPGGAGETEFGPWNEVVCSSFARVDNQNEAPEFEDSPLAVGRPVASTYLDGDTAMTPEQAAALGTAASGGSYASQICDIATGQGLGQYCSLLQTQMQVESSGNASAVGPETKYGSAYGLMQMLPDTARSLAPDTFAGMSNAQIAQQLTSNPTLSMTLGVKYFQKGLEAGDGTPEQALAYYNGGPSALKSSVTCPGQRWWECTANPGYAETRKYVSRITGGAATITNN